MNGVVKPQAMPTRRKPIVQRKMDGEASMVIELSAAIAVLNVKTKSMTCKRYALLRSSRMCSRQIQKKVTKLCTQCLGT